MKFKKKIQNFKKFKKKFKKILKKAVFLKKMTKLNIFFSRKVFISHLRITSFRKRTLFARNGHSWPI